MSAPSASSRASVQANDTWVRPYFSRYRKHLMQALGLGVLTFVFAALLMFTSGYLISRCAERPDGGVFIVLWPIAFVQIFGMGKPILRYLERLVSHDWVFRMTSDLRLRLYTALERKAMTLRREKQTGDVLGLIAEDIGHLQNLYLRTIFPTVIGWALLVCVTIFYGIFDILFALAMLVILAIIVFGLPLLSLLRNRQRIEREKELRNMRYADLTDNVLGSTDWVFSGRGSEYLEQAKAADSEIRAHRNALEGYYRVNDLVTVVVLAVGALAVFAWSSVHFGGQGLPQADWIAAFVLGFFPLADAFMPLTVAATQVNVYRDSTKRLNSYPTIDDDDLGVDPAIFDTATAVKFAIDDLMRQGDAPDATSAKASAPPDPAGPADSGTLAATSGDASASAAPLLEESDSRFAESDSSSCASLLHASNEAALQPVRDSAQTDADASPDAAASCGNALAEPAGSGGAETFADDARYADTDLAGPVGAVGIAIEGVSFAYDDGRTVLDGVSLEIPPGQKVAVLGRSGSGKSTLASLIRGDLTPTSGSIRIDGTHVSQIGEDVFRYIGVVQQEAYLFNRTLRDNLLIGREDATDEEVWAALDAVELGEMARRLPQGLDTMVDEAGLRFSGGERHRIALARVLLAHVPVILLDEPTVGLDPLTENALLDTLFSSMADKTFVMITHHLQGIERFDRVVFIEDGRIEMDGSPADLQATSERYRALRSFDRGIDA